MKIQDFIFVFFLLVLIAVGKRKIFIAAGLGCFLIAMPLYAKWIFFTAQRLVEYGACFIGIGVIMDELRERFRIKGDA